MLLQCPECGSSYIITYHNDKPDGLIALLFVLGFITLFITWIVAIIVSNKAKNQVDHYFCENCKHEWR